MNLLTFTIILLFLQTFLDLAVICAGYIKFTHFWYWLADKNGPVGFFRENEGLFNREVESHRNLILTFIFFCASWSLASTSCAIYFRKRQFLSKGWPLTIWKFAGFMCAMRLFMMIWTMLKFHFYLIFDLMRNPEFDETEKISLESLKELYENGTIGAVPLFLVALLPLNVLIIGLMVKTALDTAEWRALNVSKRIYYS